MALLHGLIGGVITVMSERLLIGLFLAGRCRSLCMRLQSCYLLPCSRPYLLRDKYSKKITPTSPRSTEMTTPRLPDELILRIFKVFTRSMSRRLEAQLFGDLITVHESFLALLECSNVSKSFANLAVQIIRQTVHLKKKPNAQACLDWLTAFDHPSYPLRVLGVEAGQDPQFTVEIFRQVAEKCLSIKALELGKVPMEDLGAWISCVEADAKGTFPFRVRVFQDGLTL